MSDKNKLRGMARTQDDNSEFFLHKDMQKHFCNLHINAITRCVNKANSHCNVKSPKENTWYIMKKKYKGEWYSLKLFHDRIKNVLEINNNNESKLIFMNNHKPIV